jgi:Outer membrane protein beta-barrel domain
MKRAIAFVALLACAAVPAAAQTEGKVSVGGSLTFVKPTDDGVQSLVGGGPLVRLNPRKGWGVAGGLSWFRADLDNPAGGSGAFGTLRVRPLMAGVAYTVGEQPVLVSFSIVAGPSWNQIKFDDEFIRALPVGSQQPSVSIDTSFAVRPGVNLTYTVAPRVALIGFGGYIFNRPDVTYRNPAGQELRKPWKADAFLVSVGAVYSLF